MDENLKAFKLGKIIIFFFVMGVCHSLLSQSPASNGSLQSPFDPITRISLGLERGIGYGGIKHYNFNGIRSVIDFVSYKFDFGLGVTQSEIGKNALSVNTVVAKNLDEDNIDKVEQFSIYTGFGYTKLYIDDLEYSEQINVPLGLCLGLDGPLPSIDINLCLSFRAQYRMMKFQTTAHEIGYGINVGGIFFMSGERLGIRINYDLLNIKSKEGADRITENALSIGIQYIIY